MNQKEYEIIAETLKSHYRTVLKIYGQGDRSDTVLILMHKFATALEKNYPRTFDYEKFLKACGIGEK